MNSIKHDMLYGQLPQEFIENLEDFTKNFNFSNDSTKQVFSLPKWYDPTQTVFSLPTWWEQEKPEIKKRLIAIHYHLEENKADDNSLLRLALLPYKFLPQKHQEIIKNDYIRTHHPNAVLRTLFKPKVEDYTVAWLHWDVSFSINRLGDFQSRIIQFEEVFKVSCQNHRALEESKSFCVLS